MNKNQIAQRIIDLKKQIEEKKNRLQQIKAKQEMILTEMEREYKCTTIKEATMKARECERLLHKKEKEVETLLTHITNSLQKMTSALSIEK